MEWCLLVVRVLNLSSFIMVGYFLGSRLVHLGSWVAFMVSSSSDSLKLSCTVLTCSFSIGAA